MVERFNTAGWWPALYEPIKKAGETVAGWFAPRSDASASGDGYQISMELPGVAAEDVEITMHDGTLLVRGEKRFEREEEGETYFFSEREYGTFQRSFRLPADAQADGIVADFRNGVLTIAIPKVAPAAVAGRKIPINVG